MQFKLFALSAALSAVSRVQAILPAAEVVVNINTVTTVSADTNRIAQSISVVNFPINTPVRPISPPSLFIVKPTH